MAGSNVKAVPISIFNAAGFTGGYDSMNVGLTQPCFRIRISNLSNIAVGISYDGATLNDVIKAGDILDFPAQMNARGPGYVANFKKGTKIYGVSAAPGVGFIYIAGYYQD